MESPSNPVNVLAANLAASYHLQSPIGSGASAPPQFGLVSPDAATDPAPDFGKKKSDQLSPSDGNTGKKPKIAGNVGVQFKIPEGDPSARFRSWRKLAVKLEKEGIKPPTELALPLDLFTQSTAQLLPIDSPPLVAGLVPQAVDQLQPDSLILFWSPQSGLQILRLATAVAEGAIPAPTASDLMATIPLAFHVLGWSVDTSIPAIPYPATRNFECPSRQDLNPLHVPLASPAVINFLFQNSPALQWDPIGLTTVLASFYPSAKKKSPATNIPASHATAASFLQTLFPSVNVTATNRSAVTPSPPASAAGAATTKDPQALAGIFELSDSSDDTDDGSTPVLPALASKGTGRNPGSHIPSPNSNNLNIQTARGSSSANSTAASTLQNELAAVLMRSIHKSPVDRANEKDSYGKALSVKLPSRFFGMLSDPQVNQLQQSVQLSIHNFMNVKVSKDLGGVKIYFPTTIGELRCIAEGWRLRTKYDILMFLPLNETFGVNAYDRQSKYMALGDGTLSASSLKTLDALLKIDSASILSGNLAHWKVAVNYLLMYLDHVLQAYQAVSVSMFQSCARLFTYVSRHNQGLLPSLVGDLLLEVSFRFSLDLAERAMTYVSDLFSTPCPTDVFAELPFLTPMSPIPQLFMEAVNRTSVRRVLMAEAELSRLKAGATALKDDDTTDSKPERHLKSGSNNNSEKAGRRGGRGRRSTTSTAQDNSTPSASNPNNNPNHNVNQAHRDTTAVTGAGTGSKWVCVAFSTQRGCNKASCNYAHQVPKSQEEADRLRRTTTNWPNAGAFTEATQHALARFPPSAAATQAHA